MWAIDKEVVEELHDALVSVHVVSARSLQQLDLVHGCLRVALRTLLDFDGDHLVWMVVGQCPV